MKGKYCKFLFVIFVLLLSGIALVSAVYYHKVIYVFNSINGISMRL